MPKRERGNSSPSEKKVSSMNLHYVISLLRLVTHNLSAAIIFYNQPHSPASLGKAVYFRDYAVSS